MFSDMKCYFLRAFFKWRFLKVCTSITNVGAATTNLNPFVHFRGEKCRCILDESLHEENGDEEPQLLLTHFNGRDIVQVWSDATEVKGTYTEGKDGFVVASFRNGDNYLSAIPNTRLAEDGILNTTTQGKPPAKPKAKGKAEAKGKGKKGNGKKGKAKVAAKPVEEMEDEEEGNTDDAEEVEEGEDEVEIGEGHEGEIDEGEVPKAKAAAPKKVAKAVAPEAGAPKKVAKAKAAKAKAPKAPKVVPEAPEAEAPKKVTKAEAPEAEAPKKVAKAGAPKKVAKAKEVGKKKKLDKDAGKEAPDPKKKQKGGHRGNASTRRSEDDAEDLAWPPQWKYIGCTLLSWGRAKENANIASHAHPTEKL